MTVTVTVLIPAKIAENTQTTQYVSTNVTTIIDKFTATNYASTSANISVHLVTSGGVAGNDNIIVKTKTLLAGETYIFPELVGHVLLAGGFISTITSVASTINIRASGRTIT